MSELENTRPAPDAVLAKAVLRASEQLGLTQAHLGAVIGLHRTAVSRLNSKPSLDPRSKEGELALLLIRLARSLFALTGGDTDWMRHFMRSHNRLTGGVPSEQIRTIQGLMTVLRFADGIRGKV
ncbi:MbcA/ParS/Xre antitoxin family protein [Marinobacterium marinum]|uniref:XRE family transcriptional regulator n=1 Tax=Marinobacterium marinum TaxID=2756129 RepID=A0A7W1WX84_9GAMM|nr:XRE family transcriptional regulator [Marinobacterium marinum]MBA4501833.1 XRE family transcriptional regulator [Marinobacterium marinum]